MDFWDLESVLHQIGGPGPTDTDQYKGPVQHAWYSAQHHAELAVQTPVGTVYMVRIGENRKVATFISDEAIDGENYDRPDKVYVGMIVYARSFAAPANLVPVSFDSNSKPEDWVEEPEVEGDPVFHG